MKQKTEIFLELLLKEIQKYSKWGDRDSIDELKLYLDVIYDLVSDCLEMVSKGNGSDTGQLFRRFI